MSVYLDGSYHLLENIFVDLNFIRHIFDLVFELALKRAINPELFKLPLLLYTQV